MIDLIHQLCEVEVQPSARLKMITFLTFILIAPALILYMIKVALKFTDKRSDKLNSNLFFYSLKWVFLSNCYYFITILTVALTYIYLIKPSFLGTKGHPIDMKMLVLKEGVIYNFLTDTPHTGGFIISAYPPSQTTIKGSLKKGIVHGSLEAFHKNGHLATQSYYKDGKLDGTYNKWHENGQKLAEANFKDGEPISQKWWDSKGEPVNTYEEAIK